MPRGRCVGTWAVGDVSPEILRHAKRKLTLAISLRSIARAVRNAGTTPKDLAGLVVIFRCLASVALPQVRRGKFDLFLNVHPPSAQQQSTSGIRKFQGPLTSSSLSEARIENQHGCEDQAIAQKPR